MKILKIVGMILGAIVVLFLVVTLFLPPVMSVETTGDINNTPTVIYAQLNDVHNFNNWSPFFEKDSSTKFQFDGPERGPGAIYVWLNAGQKISKGRLEITRSDAYSLIEANLNINGNSTPGRLTYELKNNNGLTNLTMRLQQDLGFLGRWSASSLKPVLKKALDNGLINLKTYCEKLPNYSLKIVDTIIAAQPLVIISDSCRMDSKKINLVLAKAYQELTSYMKFCQIPNLGPPITITNTVSQEEYSFTLAFPVKTTKGLYITGRINAGQLPGGRVVKGVIVGPVVFADTYYNDINKYIALNRLQKRGKSWEVYVDYPDSTGKGRSETHIYFPVE